MTAPPVWKRGFVSLGVFLVAVTMTGGARAEVVFRKKSPDAPAAASSSGGEAGTEAAPAGEGAADKTPAAPQADDKDTPEAQSQREKARADAALARQARNAQLARDRDRTTPFYQKWQFWAIAGGVVAGAVLAIWGGAAVAHQLGGGDVRACSAMNDPAGCFGEGR